MALVLVSSGITHIPLYHTILYQWHLILVSSFKVGVCLREEGIHPGDTRDEMGRETFHPFAPEYHLIPGAISKRNWLHNYNKWEVKSGPDCCSDHSITFHYVAPKNMYILEYFIYHLHPYGIHHVH